MNIGNSLLLKEKKTKNPFKNPYHLTFFNQSLAKQFFAQKTIINKSKEPTERTPNIKIAFNSKLRSSGHKIVPKSKTPKIHSICKISRERCQPMVRTKDEIKCETKENGFVSITISQPQKNSMTRNSKLSKNNSTKKDKTITGVTTKAIAKKKVIRLNMGETDSLLTANLLPKDVRLKMLKKDNAILLRDKQHREENDNDTIHMENNQQHNKTNATYINSSLFISPIKHNPVSNETINNNRFSAIKPKLRLEYNLKNQYRELIALYLISE